MIQSSCSQLLASGIAQRIGHRSRMYYDTSLLGNPSNKIFIRIHIFFRYIYIIFKYIILTLK